MNMLESEQTVLFTEEDSFAVRVYFYSFSYSVTGKDSIIIDYLLVVIYLWEDWLAQSVTLEQFSSPNIRWFLFLLD